MPRSQPITLARIRRAVAEANGLDAAGVSAEWIERPRLVKYPSGYRGRRAIVLIRYPGYRAFRALVNTEADGSGMSVR